MGNSAGAILRSSSTLLAILFISSCNGVGTAEFDSVARGANTEGETPIVVVPSPPAPVPPPVFAGLESVTGVTDSTATLNWSSSPDAANYHLYDVSSGTQVYRGLIVDPNANSFLVSGLTPDADYAYRLRMIHNQGLVDTNTVDVSFHTNPVPSTPMLALHTPATSPGVEGRPTFLVSGVKKDDVIKIYSDDQCSTLAGEEISQGENVQVRVDSPLVNGIYQFSANATGAVGNISECSASVEYIKDMPAYFPMVEATNATLAGITDSTFIAPAVQDDHATPFVLPFSFNLGGSHSTWYMVSNSYITGTNPATAWSGFTGNNPNIPRIMFGAADNSYQRLYTKSGTNYFRIRYEGNNSTSGIAGSPTIVFEVTFFRPTETAQFIQVTFGQHSRPTGVFAIAHANDYYLTHPSITENSSYVFVGTVDSASWVLHPNSRIIGNGIDE